MLAETDDIKGCRTVGRSEREDRKHTAEESDRETLAYASKASGTDDARPSNPRPWSSTHTLFLPPHPYPLIYSPSWQSRTSV